MHRFLLSLALSIVANLVVAVAANAEPILWEENGHWYEIVGPSTNWAQARDLAEARTWMGVNGHLVTITSEQETAFLWTTFGPNPPQMWFGGYQDPVDSPPAENWYWVTGEPWDYTNWGQGEPNDAGHAEYWLHYGLGTNLTWNDADDGFPHLFLVEYEGPPGACCFGGLCTEVEPVECIANGGVFVGPGTVCEPNPCLDRAGACCLANGSCVLTSVEECLGIDGRYEGDFTVCDPSACAAACCLMDSSCEVLTVEECTGVDGVYHGEFESCGTILCPGACCLEDGSCTYLIRPDCLFAGGLFQGVGFVCDPNPCPQPSACCYDNGTCDFTLDVFCAERGGTFYAGQTCDPSPCPPAGACCRANGTCVFLTDGACSQADGAYQGDGVPCDPNPCPVLGACCFGEICFQITEANCLQNGGQYLGNSTLCSDDACTALGACCLVDGQCVVTRDFICAQYGGTWAVGVGCAPGTCDDVSGACCHQDGSCEVLSGLECAGQFGMFTGDGTVCDPNPCTAAGVPGNTLLPDRVLLTQPSPNPSQGTVEFTVGLPEAASVRLRVFDANGRLVETIVDGWMEAGLRRLNWSGESQSSGVYFVELRTATGTISRSFALVR